MKSLHFQEFSEEFSKLRQKFNQIKFSRKSFHEKYEKDDFRLVFWFIFDYDEIFHYLINTKKCQNSGKGFAKKVG